MRSIENLIISNVEDSIERVLILSAILNGIMYQKIISNWWLNYEDLISSLDSYPNFVNNLINQYDFKN